ncbi:enoyl-CoA hydratase/isomerase family protein [Corynebacterium sp. TAE3-ERU12]|uniref:3-hydroxyisobutyryl-CoA hydrolase n=1 Tax=Corynebacterium sp. TAE3-ERU12 TaxID=2849491 RepID=UPI001C442693|nr:3-hydroxyisobutyryl-CoA hydrolase [Corynebacterium sp. TAE3-ERU12]MBV7295673.1 enoyl-CoA hydratase/isomerase family protein [Corynebacterium sp. TAE3-ERU12]
MSDTLISHVNGLSGRLRLNRPQALNSLHTEMVHAIADAVETWRCDDNVSQVIIDSGHPKAFCAGGDVRAIRELQLADDYAAADRFFADEYRMNAAIAEFPKPYIAIIDGIAMGGGLGISLHGSHRVVTERASAAMPEMAIGFIPDVGITYTTQRLVTAEAAPAPEIARFVGLTGYRLSAADMLWAGWATHFVPSAKLADFGERADVDGIDAAIEAFAADPAEAGESELARLWPHIRDVFNRDTWAEIDATLDDRHTHPSIVRQCNELLRSAAPTSLVAAAELYRANAEDIDLREALANEERLGHLVRRHPNFAEGVRAVLVDKTRNPHFDPHTTDSVDPQPYREVLSG